MDVADLVASRSERYLAWLSQACTFQSLAGNDDGLAACASWVEDKLIAVGGRVERLSLDGAPDALLGHLGSGSRSLLIYDHYDVQPVDPIELWDSAPFEPEVRDGVLFARGAADNKGDLVARLAALEVYAEVHGDLPVAIRFLVEGEEETGSPSFERLVQAYGERLQADGCIWEGFGIDFEGRPEIVFGAKGLAYVELYICELNDDQHSSLAATLPSAAWRLVEALATLRSPEGRVLIDGFYDDVREPDDSAIEMLEAMPFDEGAELRRTGANAFVGGDTGLDLKKRHVFGPTCNIAGLVSGFTVPGASKTVLPKEAFAKLDLRLVPDQDPDDIVTKLRAHLDKHGFDDIEIRPHGLAHPARSSSDSLIARAAVEACDGVFEQAPLVAPMMAGTGPMYPITDTLGIPTVSPAGVHNPGSNIHAPNENCKVDDYLRTIVYTVAYLERFASLDG